MAACHDLRRLDPFPESVFTVNHDMESQIAHCAEVIERADAMLTTAGAGMSVDSGLPSFRDRDGFWNAYPVLRQAGVRFQDVASPDMFRFDPALAWGFYGHRLKLYRDTPPHEGFAILRELARPMAFGVHVFTSNVDGHFRKAGFPAGCITECHGSIHHLQCTKGCSPEIWSAEEFVPEIDERSARLVGPPPRCGNCGAIARPNVLMFGDSGWNPHRTRDQQRRLKHWLGDAERLVVIELGAGTSIPTVRHFGEFQDTFLIRINPHEPHLPESRRGVGLPLPALDALRRLRLAMQAR
jgi:NAD-dependent SIR2 family protein deacetylase